MAGFTAIFANCSITRSRVYSRVSCSLGHYLGSTLLWPSTNARMLCCSLWPPDGATGKVKGSPKSSELILWGPWISIPNVMEILFNIFKDISQKYMNLILVLLWNGNTKASRIHALGTMSVCTKWHSNPSSSCWDILSLNWRWKTWSTLPAQTTLKWFLLLRHLTWKQI